MCLRTVQFYDQKGLVKPTCIRDGKRLYDEDALARMRKVCVLKTLGFSLNEIKNIIEETRVDELYAVLMQKVAEIKQQQKHLQKQASDIELLCDLLKQEEQIGSIDQIQILQEKREQFKKKLKLQYVMLVIFIVLEFVLFICAQQQVVSMVFAISVVITVLCFLIRFHARYNAYICPTCHTYFELSFLQDMCTLNNGRKGKYCTCPSCGRKGMFKEQFRR